MEELRGRNALVTGAGGGLGGYIARSLATAGVNLALTDLPGSSLDSLVGELRARGVAVEQTPADLADLAERQHLADWATEALGPLDVLVNNAGLEFGGSFLQMTEEELSSIVAVNLLAVMDLTRVVLPGMLERGRGHIVNIASLAGKVPAPYLAAYAATKHGVVGFTHALRAENGGGAPVGFSAICPGFVTRVGMYARFESVVKAPRIIGTVTPEAVGDGVVRAIQKNLPEVIVNKGPARPLVLLSALAPSLAGRVGRLGPLREYGERMSQVRGRL